MGSPFLQAEFHPQRLEFILLLRIIITTHKELILLINKCVVVHWSLVNVFRITITFEKKLLSITTCKAGLFLNTVFDTVWIHLNDTTGSASQAKLAQLRHEQNQPLARCYSETCCPVGESLLMRLTRDAYIILLFPPLQTAL